MKTRIVSVILCLFLMTSVITVNFGFTSPEINASQEQEFTAQSGAPPAIQNVTFRLLAIEGFMTNRTSTSQNPPAGVVWCDFPTKSAQYFIQNLLPYNNWQNTTTGNFRYISHVHLLSYDPNAVSLPYYVGQPTNSNVVNEIKTFLSQTAPGESNALTIRIFYYAGHSGVLVNYPTYPPPVPPPNSFGGTVYMCLGTDGSNPAEYKQIPNPVNPQQNITVPKAENPSDYEELWDCQLDKLMLTGDLSNSNCTLMIFDTCHSGGFIPALTRKGRVIMTACTRNELAWGWQPVPPAPASLAPGQWNWFTGQQNAYYSNGTNYGPLGLIGGVRTAKDLNNDGWRSASEIWKFANTSCQDYSTVESKPPPGMGIGAPQTPQIAVGVKGGDIPLVQFWVEPPQLLPFPYNAPRAPPKAEGQAWAQFHNMAGRTGFTSAIGPRTSPLWNAQLSDSAFSSGVVAEGQLIIATKDGLVHDLDLGTGQTIWTFQATHSPIFSTPAVLVTPVIDSYIFVASVGEGHNGTLYALDDYTGRLRWNFTTPPETGGIFASPAVDNGRVFIATMGGGGGSGSFVYALNATTGAMIWPFPVAGPVKSSLAVADGRVFVATMGGGGGGGGIVYALDEMTGMPAWPTPFETTSPIMATPAVADGMVFVATMSGGGGGGGAYVWALNEFTGTPMWPFPFATTTGPITSSPAVDSSRHLLVVGSYGGIVYGLQEMTGTTLWSHTIGSVNMSSPAISSNGLIYIGSTNGYLYCLNETNGSEVWSYGTGSSVLSSPALTDNHVLFGAMNGKAYCFGPPFPVHDVAVTSVTASKTVASSMGSVMINCTIMNRGNVAERFNVTFAYGNITLWMPPLYHTPVAVHTQQVVLDPGMSVNVSYSWTPDVAKGMYALIGESQILPRENNTADNTLSGFWVFVSIVGDINGDRKVNLVDVFAEAKAFGSRVGQPRYKPNLDLNSDGKIDLVDYFATCKNFGKQW